MNRITGSILILAAAVLLAPAVDSPHRFDEGLIFGAPVLIAGVIFLVKGARDQS